MGCNMWLEFLHLFVVVVVVVVVGGGGGGLL